MKSGDGFIQGYNAQTAVDEAHQIIVAQGVSNQPPDAEYLIPMIDRVVENCGAVPDHATADAGYCSEENIARATSRGVDQHAATGRIKHALSTEAPAPAPTENDTLKARMREKLATPEGKKIYSRRKVIVEPTFGQIKNRGFRQFLLRGLEKVRGEWALISISHSPSNLQKGGKPPLLKLYVAVAA